MAVPVLARKDPDAEGLAYQVDLSAVLEYFGDTLDSVAVFVSDAVGVPIVDSDLIVESVSFSTGGIITFWLAGGSAELDGTPRRYHVRVRWTTARTDPVQTIDYLTLVIPIAEK